MSDKVIEVKIPSANTADEWNQNISEGAEKAGVELPKPGAIRITEAPDPDKKDDELVRSTLRIGDKEMVFEGTDAADVLRQYSAAVEAAQLAAAPAPAAAVVEEKKPGLSEAELFDVRTKLMAGDPSALDTYLLGSGLLDKYLESKGLSVDQLKTAATTVQSNDVNEQWKTATKDFISKNKEYPGGAQNTYLMGLMLAELGLRNKPSVESFEAAYAKMKERNIVFPVAAKTAEEIAAEAAATAEAGKKKDPPSSTAVGSHGGKQDLVQQPGAPTGKVELDTTKLTIREASDSWNELLRRGYKPEQIVIKQ